MPPKGAIMTTTAAPAAPRTIARVTGALYLYIMAAGMFAEAFVRDRLIVGGDAAATARNISSSAMLWRWGLAADVSTTLCDVAVAALLFVLLRPAGPATSTVAAFFRVAYGAVMAGSAALLAAPLALLGGSGAAAGSAQLQVQALVMYSLRLHGAAFDIGLVLFGAHLILVGALIMRSTFLPRLLGAALALAGACYLANSFIGFLSPALPSMLYPWILLPGFLAEAALTLWLIVKGVDTERWAPRA